MTVADLREYAQFNRDFANDVRAGKAAGKSADEVARAWKIPANYAGHATPTPIRLLQNVQVVFDELKLPRADLPDPVRPVVGDEQPAVARDGDADRAAPRFDRRAVRAVAGEEAGQEVFDRPGRPLFIGKNTTL